MNDIEVMRRRIRAALKKVKIFSKAKEDLTHTLKELGLEESHAQRMAHATLRELAETNDLESSEGNIFSMFQGFRVGSHSLTEIIDQKMAGRAKIIFDQVLWYFTREPRLNKVIDYGYGDGGVSQLLIDMLELPMVGCDVKRYPAQGVTVPTIEFLSHCRLDCDARAFDAGLMTNVAHHEKDNDLILAELARIIKPGGILVVIETVPTENTEESFDITFLNDYFYNRLFHQADVPVPGTYEMAANWPERFRKHGFLLESSANLGYDQPTIRDWHVLYVFRRSFVGHESNA